MFSLFEFDIQCPVLVNEACHQSTPTAAAQWFIHFHEVWRAGGHHSTKFFAGQFNKDKCVFVSQCGGVGRNMQSCISDSVPFQGLTVSACWLCARETVTYFGWLIVQSVLDESPK